MAKGIFRRANRMRWMAMVPTKCGIGRSKIGKCPESHFLATWLVDKAGEG